ncbi:hypothetical protein SHIRM173S_10215 [Streptomyces hirsutus]
MQETMLRALGSLGSLKDPGSFRSWLVAITMNQIRRHWRSESHGGTARVVRACTTRTKSPTRAPTPWT